MMEQHFRAEVPTLSSRGASGLPAALDSVMRKALAKDPDARYRTARDLVTALRDAAGTGAMKARGAVTPPGASRTVWMPAIAGVAVLGAGIVAVVVLGRDREKPPVAAPPRARDVPPSGSVSIEVTSKPAGAEVRSNKGGLDLTPTQLFAAPGDELVLTVRKPGFIPEKRKVQAGPNGSVVDVRLIEVTSFKGVWQLPNRELRVFERSGDQVDVFKTLAVVGARTFFTRYAFELVDDGIGFGGEDLIADPKAPHEPSCNVRMRVDYVYDVDKDALEQRREHVELDFADGKCTERSRRVQSVALVRADRQPLETHELAMPVGSPKLDKKSPVKKVNPKSKTDVPFDQEGGLEKKRSKQATLKKPTATYTSPKNVTSGAEQNLSGAPNAANAQIVPAPNATPLQVSEPVPQAQQATKPVPIKQQQKK
jgi:hypothetical protein